MRTKYVNTAPQQKLLCGGANYKKFEKGCFMKHL